MTQVEYTKLHTSTDDEILIEYFKRLNRGLLNALILLVSVLCALIYVLTMPILTKLALVSRELFDTDYIIRFLSIFPGSQGLLIVYNLSIFRVILAFGFAFVINKLKYLTAVSNKSNTSKHHCSSHDFPVIFVQNNSHYRKSFLVSQFLS